MILGIARSQWRFFGRSLVLWIGNSVKFLILTLLVAAPCVAQDVAPDASAERIQKWNFHVQNTDVVQGYPAFPAQYSGPQSLPSGGEGARNRFTGCDGRSPLMEWS